MSSQNENRDLNASDPSSGTVLDVKAQWRHLKDEWRLMFRTETLLPDALAGLSVALVALPLSLAVAAASGTKPEVGIMTAVVGGIVVALFGGCRLQVSGPAVAMTFLVYEITTKYGPGGLIAATFLTALFQILAGYLRLGRFMELMPKPVIAGFLSGIGITILCMQLPVILQLEVRHDEEGGALAVLWQVFRQMPKVEPTAFTVGATAAVLMFLVPRVWRRLPAPLFAVVGATVLPSVMGWDRVSLIGPLPHRFPGPGIPVVPWGAWNELVMATLALFILASIESLLSASVVDSLDTETKVDNDQELVGQGLGNVAAALLGGLPVTGVIARSATNVQAGARTRLASVLHALFLLVMMYVLAPWVARIPRAALSGMLVAVAARMIEPSLLRALWKRHRAEALIFLVTAGTIVATDLIVGVPVGMAAAFLYVVYEMSRLRVRQVPFSDGVTEADVVARVDCPSVQVLEVEGPLFFASGFHLRNLARRVTDGTRCLVLDVGAVPFLDVTGAVALDEAVQTLRARGSVVILARPPRLIIERLKELNRDGELSAINDCPIYDDLRDAMLHAAADLTDDRLCGDCRAQHRCRAISKALESIGTLERTPVPKVRAVVPVEPVNGTLAPADIMTSDYPSADGSIRPDSPTSWKPRRGRPSVHASAFIDPRATIIGEVEVGERVYVGPGVSVRADEGTPFHIGADSNLQDGVILHALKGKVVLVKGRSFAIYVGKNVSLTHGTLVHGPSYVGDDCFLGFKSMVHDSVVGEGCVVGMGAVVLGVTLPPGRYVAHNTVIDTQEKADALQVVGPEWARFREEVVEVNQELAAGHLVCRPGIETPSEEPTG